MSKIVCPESRVEEAWIDYNGHMNMAFYHVVFDRAVDHAYDQLDVGIAYVEREQLSLFTMEVHVHYLQELSLNDPIEVRWQLLDHDHKRLHFFEEMYHATEGWLAATSEQLALNVDMNARRSAPFPDAALARIEALAAQQSNLPAPPQVGQIMGIRR